MLTIFAIPKAFQGHTGVIQRNAVSTHPGSIGYPQTNMPSVLGPFYNGARTAATSTWSLYWEYFKPLYEKAAQKWPAVKPNSSAKTEAGADAPNRSMPMARPRRPV